MSNSLLPANANDEQIKVALRRFDSTLASYRDDIGNLVKSKGINPDEFYLTVINSFKRNPKLLECELPSVIGGVLAAAELGLMPNTPFQLSFLVPYRNSQKNVTEAQFQIGYQGWIELFNRHPNISHFDCELVFEHDEFEERKGVEQTLIHKPAKGERGKRIGAYAIVWTTNGKTTWTFMRESEIMAIKKLSKSPAWDEAKDPMGWMWKKCAVKQVAKKLPKTREIEIAIYAEDAEHVGKPISVDPERKTIAIEALETEADKAKAAESDKNQRVMEGAAEMFPSSPSSAIPG
jgi:recombination protein RecT